MIRTGIFQGSRVDLRIWVGSGANIARFHAVRLTSDRCPIATRSTWTYVDTQHSSETDSDYNPDPNDFVNFVADMYQTPGPGAGQHGPICHPGHLVKNVRVNHESRLIL